MSATAHRAGARERAPAAPAHGRSSEREASRGGSRTPGRPAVARAGNLHVQRAARAGCSSCGAEQLIQRSCGCGGGGGGTADMLLQREAADGGSVGSASGAAVRGPGQPMDPGTRRTMEAGFGRDFSGVRIHTGPDAASSADAVNARAFTVGQDVVFAGGEYQPGSPSGQRLLAHELVHTVQQAGARAPAPQHALRVSQPGDPLEREADRVASQVLAGAESPSPISAGAAGSVQRWGLGDLEDAALSVVTAPVDLAVSAGETIYDVGATAVETVEEGAEMIAGFASDVWNAAHDLADALGAAIDISGTTLVITVPSMQVCPDGLAFQFSLPEIGTDIPFAFADLPISPIVSIYGEVGLHAGITPEISAQLGPCTLNGMRIVVDPLGASISASGSISVTTALGLGAEARVGLFGEVGMLILWPDPPLIIEVPVIHAEAGLAGFARGIVIGNLDVSGSFSGGLGGLSLSSAADLDLGLAADLGLAGYGALSLLGMNVCTLYWPLWEWHDQMTISTSGSLDVDVGTGGASVDIVVSDPVIDAVPFESLGLDISREVFSDDCPLCDVFTALGLMPSQNGGGWKGQPRAPWADGPLADYPVNQRDPGIASGAKCRGACGPDCDTCSHEDERIVCQTMEDGHHEFWRYPNFEECGSHDGCRQHDGSYDWCADGGEVTIWGPCHRIADFECLCEYGAPNCIGWIFGSPPFDEVLYFSDEPEPLCHCIGPCPAESTDMQGNTTYELCLPEVILLDRQQLLHEEFFDSTGEIKLWEKLTNIPYTPIPILLELFAQADIAAMVDAGAGPVWLSDMCLDVNPRANSYHGSAQINASVDLGAALQIVGKLIFRAGWGCLFTAVDVEAALTALAEARAIDTLSARVDVSCVNGEIMLDASAFMDFCVKLRLALEASLNVTLFTFPVVHETWELANFEWGRCWRTEFGFIQLPLTTGVEPTLDVEQLSAIEVVRALFDSARDDRHTLGAVVDEFDDFDAGYGPVAGPNPPAPGHITAAPGASLAAMTTTTSSGDLTIPADPAAATGKTNPCPISPIVTPTVVFDSSGFPCIAPHIKNAQSKGRPPQLNRQTGRSNIRRNRRAACGSHPGPRSCDEYPFASTKQGGAGACTSDVPLSENNKQGGTLSAFYKKHNLTDGKPFKVAASVSGSPCAGFTSVCP